MFVGFRASQKLPSERYPYGYERAEDLAGIGVALVIWTSAAVAGAESVTKLLGHGSTTHLGWGIAGSGVGIAGNQLVARCKLVVGRRIRSATIVADAKHSWLDALSSAGAMLGLTGVALGWGWADAVAGIIVTGFICHVGWEVGSNIAHRLLDGIDPDIITTAETPPPPYLASPTLTPVPAGRGAPCASRSKALSSQTPRSPKPTKSAAVWLPH